MASRSIVLGFIVVFLLSTFSVSAFEILTVNSPLSNQNLSGTITLNAAPDEAAVNVTFRFQNAVTGVYVLNTTIFNDTAPDTSFVNNSFDSTQLADGVYNITVNATNVTGTTIGNNTVVLVTVDNTAPVVNPISANASNFTTTHPVLSFNFTDNLFATAGCTLFINDTAFGTNLTTLNGTTTSNLTNATVAQGTSNWYTNCTDASGNTGMSTTLVLTVDSIAPTVSIVSPTTEQNVSTGTLQLNATVTDAVSGVASVEFNVTNGTDGLWFTATNVAGNAWNYTLDLSTLAQGSHTMTVFANDTFGSTNNTETVTFTVDSVAPTVNLITTNATNFTTSQPSLVFNFTDAVRTTASCTLYINGTAYGTNTTTLNATSTSIQANATVSDGSSTWYANCTDVSSNEGTVTARVLRVNSGGPTITITTPDNASAQSSNFTVNATVTDLFGVATVRYRIANSTGTNLTGWLNATNLSSTSYTFTVDIGSLDDANHTFTINATDTLGSATDNVTYLFLVDTAAPTVTSFTLSASSVTVGGSITSGCTANDTLDSNVTTTVTGISTTTAGTFTATCTATDDAGNTNTSTAQYTVTAAASSSSGGGGGGGGSYVAPGPNVAAQVGRLRSAINTNEPASFSFGDGGRVAVTDVVVTTNQDVKRARLTVRALKARPDDVSEPAGPIFQFMELEQDKLEAEVLDGVSISFAVPRSWLTENGIDRGNVVLLHWSESSWKTLSTVFVEETDAGLIFRSESPHFSVFAIGTGTSPTAATETTEATEENLAQEAEAEEVLPEPVAAEQEIVAEEPVKDTISQTRIFAVVALIVLGVALAAFLVKFHSAPKKK